MSEATAARGVSSDDAFLLACLLVNAGFASDHAGALAIILARNGIAYLDGIRFEISGTVTSVFDETVDPRRIIGQVDRRARR